MIKTLKIAGVAAALAFAAQAGAETSANSTTAVGGASGSINQSATLGMGPVAVPLIVGVSTIAVIGAVVAGASDDSTGSTSTGTSTGTSTH